MVHAYGWRGPSLPDARDIRLHIVRPSLTPLPPVVDLRPNCPPVYDQGQLGSCVAHSVASALEYDQMKQLFRPFIPSRLFLYYQMRVIENTVPYDSGATIRDGFKAVTNYGYCDEQAWPYSIQNFAVQPPDDCYKQAAPLCGIVYQRVEQDLDQLKAVLAREYLVCFGFSVYESFESNAVATSGMVPLPGSGEALIGGHAVALVGYLEDQKKFLVRNSWSDQWGGPLKGYFLMDYEYVLNPDLASDFWCVNHVLG